MSQIVVPASGLIYSNNLKSLTASNTTASIVLWRLTGTVLVKRLYGVCETAFSSNVTAAHWRLNDQTAQPAITLATGTTLSSLVVGQRIAKRDLAAVALEVSSLTNVGVIKEPAVKNTDEFCEFELTKKTGANTDIEFRYTTTNTPATGAMRFYIEYEPKSLDGYLAPQ